MQGNFESQTTVSTPIEDIDIEKRRESLYKIEETMDQTLRSIQKLAKCVAFEANRNTRIITHHGGPGLALFYPWEQWLNQPDSQLFT